MTDHKTIEFIDNKAAQARPDQYICITVDAQAALKSWKNSIYSFEWLNEDGTIKSFEQLSASEADKRRAVEDTLSKKGMLEKPVLGIGIQDNIEIGSGRATLLTLIDKGVETIEVHIPKSCESDFKAFLAEV